MSLPAPRLLSLLALGSAVLFAVDEDLPGPVTVQVGYSGMYPGAREVAGHNGMLLGVGLHDRDGGFFGQRGVEFDYRFARSETGRIDDLSLIYLERFPLENQVYGLLGVGAWGFRIIDRREDGAEAATRIRPGTKAAIGYQFRIPQEDVRLAFEFGGVWVLPADDYTTTGLTAGIVLGF
jgi:hypothetical protein